MSSSTQDSLKTRPSCWSWRCPIGETESLRSGTYLICGLVALCAMLSLGCYKWRDEGMEKMVSCQADENGGMASAENGEMKKWRQGSWA